MARDFDNIDDKIASSNIDITTSITISIWVYPDSLPAGNKDLVDKSTSAGSPRNYLLRQTASGKIQFAYRNSGNTVNHTFQTTNVELSTGSWQHILFTYTFGTGSTAKIIVNGVEKTSSWTIGDGNDAPLTSVDVVTIGANNASVNFWDGRIAEVVLVADLLSVNQALALSKGANIMSVYPRNIKLYMPIFGIASPEPDLSGNDFAGTVTGAVLANHAPVTSYLRKKQYGHYAEQFTPVIAISVTETGSGIDAIILSKNLKIPESGIGNETVLVSKPIFVVDSGVGTETILTGKQFIVTDSGTGIESVFVGKQFIITDSGNGVEVTVVGKGLKISESGVAIETILIGKGLLIGDAAVGTETIKLDKQFKIFETGLGEDVSIIGKNFIITDTGVGIDSVKLNKDLIASDVGTGMDSIMAINLTQPVGSRHGLPMGYIRQWKIRREPFITIQRVPVVIARKIDFEEIIKTTKHEYFDYRKKATIIIRKDESYVNKLAVGIMSKMSNLDSLGVRFMSKILSLDGLSVILNKGMIMSEMPRFDIVTPNTLAKIAEIVNIIEETRLEIDSRLRSKEEVNHMNTKTTKETMRLQQEMESKLSKIGKSINSMIKNGATMEEIKEKYRVEIGSIVANTLRQIYMLGFGFIEEFARHTVEFNEEHTRRMNGMIQEAINAIWNSIQKLYNNEQVQSNMGIKIELMSDAALVDIFAIFAFLTNIFTQRALNESTVATILSTPIVNERQIPLIWISERDEKVCPRCKNIDGQSKLPGEPYFDALTGVTVEYPPLHPNCRCRLLPLDGERVFNG